MHCITHFDHLTYKKTLEPSWSRRDKHALSPRVLTATLNKRLTFDLPVRCSVFRLNNATAAIFYRDSNTGIKQNIGRILNQTLKGECKIG